MDSDLIILLSKEDQDTLAQHINEYGYDTIKTLNDYMHKSINPDNDFTLIDVDTLITFDLRINYKIFITETEIFTREQIIEKFNLNSFKIEPELLFDHQKIEVIGDDYFMVEGNAEHLYNTKVYIGKDKWKDFMITFRFMRSLSFISESRLTITNSEKNKESEYIDKVLEQVLNNGT